VDLKMTKFPAKLLENVRDLLRDAFKEEGMKEIVRFHDRLRGVFDALPWGQLAGEGIASTLVELAVEHGILLDLAVKMGEMRPLRTDVVGLAARVRAAGADGGPVPADDLGKTVAAFLEGFRKKHEITVYIKAYKKLHDVLHELEVYIPQLEAAQAEWKANPTNPLSEDVTDYLKERSERALESRKDIESPQRPPAYLAWIATFAAEVQAISGPVVEKLPRHVERLKSLPPQGLSPLNAKLVDSSNALDPRNLIDSLDAILSALGPEGNPRTAKLRSDILAFRVMCSKLDGLIDAHNSCQAIANELQEGKGLPSVTPDDFLGWDTIKLTLAAIPPQPRIATPLQRTSEALQRFETTSTSENFRNLNVRFDALFMTTDKTLLDTTDQLATQATTLRNALDEFR
jgi:hypothetical protein